MSHLETMLERNRAMMIDAARWRYLCERAAVGFTVKDDDNLCNVVIRVLDKPLGDDGTLARVIDSLMGEGE